MYTKVAVATLTLALAAQASGDISSVYVEPVYEGYLTEPENADTYVQCFDLMVEITGDDAWTAAGAPTIGEPWIRLYGGVFFQHPAAGNDPGDPRPIRCFTDLQYDTFYTTHLCWPNTDDDCVEPSFAYGPYDTATELNANWFCTPDADDHPGNFTIARFTVIPDDPNSWCAEIDIAVYSIESTNVPFTWSPLLEGCCPADLDDDRDVDLADLAELLENYGTTGGATYWEGDLDGDDDVDLADLADLLTEYGTNCD